MPAWLPKVEIGSNSTGCMWRATREQAPLWGVITVRRERSEEGRSEEGAQWGGSAVRRESSDGAQWGGNPSQASDCLVMWRATREQNSCVLAGVKWHTQTNKQKQTNTLTINQTIIKSRLHQIKPSSNQSSSQMSFFLCVCVLFIFFVFFSFYSWLEDWESQCICSSLEIKKGIK